MAAAAAMAMATADRKSAPVILPGIAVDDDPPAPSLRSRGGNRAEQNLDKLGQLAAVAAAAWAANAIQIQKRIQLRSMRRRGHRPPGLAIDATAAAVLEILSLDSRVSATEKMIRDLIGNTPDTSKAIRLLLKQKKIHRAGTGGRHCPFRYYSA